MGEVEGTTFLMECEVDLATKHVFPAPPAEAVVTESANYTHTCYEPGTARKSALRRSDMGSRALDDCGIEQWRAIERGLRPIERSEIPTAEAGAVLAEVS
jgi:hypothetical protein